MVCDDGVEGGVVKREAMGVTLVDDGARHFVAELLAHGRGEVGENEIQGGGDVVVRLLLEFTHPGTDLEHVAGLGGAVTNPRVP